MATYHVNGIDIDSDDPYLSDQLGKAYGSKQHRPLCNCREPGIEMYIARIAGKYSIKRMPNTGSRHAFSCDSYESPPELSGLGQVMGSAIQENADDGMTTLKLNFSLVKIGGRAAPEPGNSEKDSVKTDGNKLTLRATLHYLWGEAGFNRWSPNMSGKRSWFVVRKFLIQAAGNKIAKGENIADILYIPEPFKMEEKDVISNRRISAMAKISAPVKGRRPLMLVIGEIKEIGPSRYGHKIRFKHVTDCDFMMNEDIHKRLGKRFENELSLWDADPQNRHLMAIGTFSVNPNGTPSLEEVALMVVSENWIPFETSYEKVVIDAMTKSSRRFIKGLRYNLPASRPLACLVAPDTLPEPTAMYLLPFGAAEEYVTALDELLGESHLKSWIWKVGQSDMPAIPPIQDALSL